MILRYLLSFLLLFSMAAQGQTLQGAVTDAVTKKPIFPATVINVRTQEIAYTNTNGLYSLQAQQGDLIAFTCIGYKDEKRTKPPSVLIATLNIAMEPMEYQLDEVRLRPGALTQYQYDSIERTLIYKLPLQRRPPSPFMSPVSAIAEKFSKKAKRTYRFQKDFANAEYTKFIDTRYTPEFVTMVTGITGDSIGYFMYAYPMPYDFARAASNLELKMWVRENHKDWVRKDSIRAATKK